MYHFFVTPEQVKGEEIQIVGSDVNHIKNVLRMKNGEELQISDGNNKKYLCEIASMTSDEVCLQIKEELISDTEFQISFWTAVLSAVLLAIMGVLAGLAPAFRAMDIKPVDAMRDE